MPRKKLIRVLMNRCFSRSGSRATSSGEAGRRSRSEGMSWRREPPRLPTASFNLGMISSRRCADPFLTSATYPSTTSLTA
jgi:hypothetical protein